MKIVVPMVTEIVKMVQKYTCMDPEIMKFDHKTQDDTILAVKTSL